jgi:hypothetical protein
MGFVRVASVRTSSHGAARSRTKPTNDRSALEALDAQRFERRRASPTIDAAASNAPQAPALGTSPTSPTEHRERSRTCGIGGIGALAEPVGCVGVGVGALACEASLSASYEVGSATHMRNGLCVRSSTISRQCAGRSPNP